MAALKAAREGCGDVCHNGGHCRNGECVCRGGFEGQFCEDEEESVAAELVWFFIITLIIVLAALTYWKANDIKKRVMETYARNNEGDVRERDNLVADQQ